MGISLWPHAAFYRISLAVQALLRSRQADYNNQISRKAKLTVEEADLLKQQVNTIGDHALPVIIASFVGLQRECLTWGKPIDYSMSRPDVHTLTQDTLRLECARLEKELYHLRHANFNLQQDIDSSRDTLDKTAK